MKLEIRRLRADDIGAVLDLMRSVAAERVHIATEPGFDETRYRKRMQASINDKGMVVFVATHEKRIIGELSIFENSEFGPTLGMMVDDAFRRRGVGRKLMHAGLDWARQHGIQKLSLRVFPHNHAAITLYEQTGFKMIKRLKRDVPRASGEAWDSILMQADLG